MKKLFLMLLVLTVLLTIPVISLADDNVQALSVPTNEIEPLVKLDCPHHCWHVLIKVYEKDGSLDYIIKGCCYCDKLKVVEYN